MGAMKAIEIGVFIWILSFSLAATSEIFGSGTGSVVDSDFDSSRLASRFLTPNFLDILYMMWDVMGLLSKIMLKGALLGTTVSSLIPHPFGIPPSIEMALNFISSVAIALTLFELLRSAILFLR